METQKMNRRNLFMAAGMAAAVALTIGAMVASTAQGQEAALTTGTQAPGFTATTSTGESISLADFSGQTVILEWTNHGCPFVQKHYNEQYANMQGLQAGAAEAGHVWLQVISSAPGEQGHVSGDEADAINEGRGASPAHVILDTEGTIGRAYGALTTPQMYIITGDGRLAYNGAIDSISSARVSDIPEAEAWFANALAAVEAGDTPDPANTRPYGCSIKY